MQPLESYQIINFFEWIKEQGRIKDFERIREIILKSKHNTDIIRGIYPLIEEYIVATHIEIDAHYLAKSIVVWLYNMGESDEKRKIETALLDDKYIKSIENIENDKTTDRYFSNTFKCIILPFENDDTLKNLVKRYFDLLNKESADYLDIYYSKKQLKKSGYFLKNSITKLNVPIDSLPCIAIWKNRIEDAVIIPISGINEDGLFKLLMYIIQLIKTNINPPNRFIRKCCLGEVDKIKMNNEFRKTKKEPIYKKLLWNILFPIGCSVISSVIAGIIVYFVTLKP